MLHRRLPCLALLSALSAACSEKPELAHEEMAAVESTYEGTTRDNVRVFVDPVTGEMQEATATADSAGEVRIREVPLPER